MNQQSHMLIIGGTSGIGMATASMFRQQGGRVTIVGRNRAKLEAAVQKLGPDTKGESLDAGDRDALSDLFGRVAPIDHLVIAASGGMGVGPFPHLDPGELRRGFDAKFWVHFNTAQSALPFMNKNGSIIFVTGASARFANPGTAGIAAINGAIGRLVPTLARELAPLRVNAVAPGVIETAWWADKPAALLKEQSTRAPLGRPGQPEEVADAILFLAGNAFVTGVVLDVDGGLCLT